MDYTKIAAEYELGVDWPSWSDAPDKEIMENRLIALSQLASYHAREAERIEREYQQLSDLLIAR